MNERQMILGVNINTSTAYLQTKIFEGETVPTSSGNVLKIPLQLLKKHALPEERQLFKTCAHATTSNLKLTIAPSIYAKYDRLSEFV